MSRPEPIDAIRGALKGTYEAEFPDADTDDWQADAEFVMARFEEYGLELMPIRSAHSLPVGDDRPSLTAADIADVRAMLPHHLQEWASHPANLDLLVRSLPVGDDSPSLDAERLYRAMVSLDSDDPGVFNIVAISEPDTRPVAKALAAEYARLSKEDTDDRP